MDSADKQLERAKYCIDNGCVPVDVTDARGNKGEQWGCDNLETQEVCTRCMMRYIEKGD